MPVPYVLTVAATGPMHDGSLEDVSRAMWSLCDTLIRQGHKLECAVIKSGDTREDFKAAFSLPPSPTDNDMVWNVIIATMQAMRMPVVNKPGRRTWTAVDLPLWAGMTEAEREKERILAES